MVHHLQIDTLRVQQELQRFWIGEFLQKFETAFHSGVHQTPPCVPCDENKEPRVSDPPTAAQGANQGRTFQSRESLLPKLSQPLYSFHSKLYRPLKSSTLASI